MNQYRKELGETEENSVLWTLNQRVAGSSPARLTIIFNELRQAKAPAVFVCN